MRTRSSSNLPVVSPPNPSTSNPKRRNRRRSKQPFVLKESPIDTMADQRTMAQFLRAPTEGYKDLLRACPHHGFTELHQLDTFYNALNPADQDSLNAIAGGNLLERRTQDVLTIIENKSKVHNSRNKSIVSQVKSCDANANSSSRIAKLTHAVNQQTSVVTTAITAILKQFQETPPPASVKAVEEICVTCGVAVNYNQGNSVYRPLIVPLNELEKVKRMNEANMKAMQTQINNVKNELRNEMKNSIQASMSNQTNELKNMMASFFQMNIASTSGSGSLPSNIVANLKGELKSITTQSGFVLDGPFVPTPPTFINSEEGERVEETLTDQDLSEYTIKVPPPLKMLKALLSNKEKLQELANTPLNENCSAVILKKLPKKLGDPRKFIISCGFSTSINLMPLSVWKKLGLLELISTHITLELANRAICTPAGITKDVFVSVGKFIFPADFVIVDYESDPRVPFILGRPFLRTARALIDGGNVLPEKFLDLDSTKDLHLPLHVNPLSGSTTYSSSSLTYLLEEFADELALITFSSKYDDDLQFDIESDLKEIEYLLHHDPINDIDSNLKYLIDQIESNTKNVYDDPFDSKGEKIKESKLLIDELDLPCDFLISSEYDSFLSEDFSRVDTLPSTNNKDKDFDPPLYELPFFKGVPRSKMLLPFSSENEEKVFKPGIHTFRKVHSSLITELSHQGYKVFKINKIFKNPMKIFLFNCRKDTHILAVLYLHFYPLD
nr:reverse transcriptase domain-containing protein [Tanacetum cinerariifolium]